MNEEIYIPQPKQKVFFTFDYDEVKIKHFPVISAFLSNFFVVKGKKILKITYYVLFFPSVFVICFSVDLVWIITKNIGKLIFYISKKIFETFLDIGKYLIKKFFGKILIILGFAIGIMLVYDFFANNHYEEFFEVINEWLNLILEE